MGDGAAKKLMFELKEDWRSAGVDDKDMAMLGYAEMITLNPASIVETDVEDLRAHGWTDIEILEIACLASYRNYMANALGVEAEGHHFADDLATRERLAEGMK